MLQIACYLSLVCLVVSARVGPLPFGVRQSSLNRVEPQFNINSGGDAVGRFVGENLQWIVGNTTSFAVEGASIGGAEDKNRPMYKSHRYGIDATEWGYDIPVMEPGTYGCTFHFAETYSESFAAGARVFSLYVATTYGEPHVFDNIDIIDELNGAPFTVLTKTALNLVITGVLSIRVRPLVGDAIISGVTCERTGQLPAGVDPDYDTDTRIPTGTVTDTLDSDPINPGVGISGTELNINCGGDAIGRFLAEDHDWIRGNTSNWEGPPDAAIGGAEEQNVAAVVSHRYGIDAATWAYVIPVHNSGFWDCSLHFAETDHISFFVGARVFDLTIMDRQLVNVDIFAQSSQFTSVVHTFPRLRLQGNLIISLTPKVGNAFLSAITCEKSADFPPDQPDPITIPIVTEQPDPQTEDPTASPLVSPIEISGPGPGDVTTSPSPSSLPSSVVITVPNPGEPSPTPTPSIDNSSTSPTPSGTTTSASTPSPSTAPEVSQSSSPHPSPVSIPPVTESPLVETSTPSANEQTPSPSVSAPTTTSVPDVSVDPPLAPGDGEFIQMYELMADVSDATFDETTKEALLKVFTDAIAPPSKFALHGIRRMLSSRMLTFRQSQTVSTYEIDLQARHKGTDMGAEVNKYIEFVKDGTVNNALSGQDIDNVIITFRNAPNIDNNAANPSGGVTPQESSSKVPAIVGSVVGGCIVGLIIIAFVAFFITKNQRSERDTTMFDAPPPVLTESEPSSIRERSETNMSVEYLDDDSTFTTATSRAGDHVDQVGFVKDIFGRGTHGGTHGQV